VIKLPLLFTRPDSIGPDKKKNNKCITKAVVQVV